MLRDIKLFEEKESKTETDIKHIVEKNKELVSLRKKTMEGVLPVSYTHLRAHETA